MSRIPRGQWIKAIRMLDGKCWYCGRDATTVDHIIPRSEGGDNNASNLRPACLSCNNLKESLTTEEFRFYLSELLGRTLFSSGYFYGSVPIVFFGEDNASPLLF